MCNCKICKNLSMILTKMEQDFDIPLLEQDVSKFCENENNQKIYALYKLLADIRDI